MAQLTLTVQERSQVGGNHPRRLRGRGLIPAVLYGGGEAAVSLALDGVRMKKEAGFLHENQIVALEIEGGGDARPRPAIVKDIQVDHISGALLHIDFQQISLDEKLTATVAVKAVGEPIGVTRDGGILEHILREIEIHCLPGDIPEAVEVGVSALEIGDTIHVGDIRLAEGIEILTEPDIGIFTVAAPISEEEAEALEAAAAPEEAEAVEPAAEAEAVEPAAEEKKPE
jgi:large subunit ribosomal protein L25